ncbi:MAG: hypothetical protein CMO74_00350 [Verrucomicrobiales bacterium]|nr:hypothetical protein [Verrucomicrobiales bacterium]|tara:strand:- start:3547 stop:4128 length:582 start_codon:yes stop_codon:yes gene_type:complete
MGTSSRAAKRPTQLSPLAKGVVCFAVAISFITGFMTSEMLEDQEPSEGQGMLQGQVQTLDPELFGDGESQPAPPAEKAFNWRGLHGLTSPFMAIVFGWLLFQHFGGGLRMRKNLWSGLPLAVVFGGLILTGGLILYPEFLFGLVDSHSRENWLKETHDFLGWLLLVLFVVHLIGAKKVRKFFEKSIDTETRSH